jgi:superfamily II DNA helicase RecQ
MFGFRKKRFEDTANELCSLYEKRRDAGDSPRIAVLYVLRYIKQNYRTSSVFAPNESYLESVFDSLEDLDGDPSTSRKMVCNIFVNTIAYELHPECKFLPSQSALMISDPRAYRSLASSRLSYLVDQLIVIRESLSTKVIEQDLYDALEIGHRDPDWATTVQFGHNKSRGFEDNDYRRQELESILSKIDSVDIESYADSFTSTDKINQLIALARNLLDADEKFLLNRLMAWRDFVARDLAVPAHIVVSDKILLLCAFIKPTSEEGLLEVGLGVKRVRLYGKQLLGVVQRCSA